MAGLNIRWLPWSGFRASSSACCWAGGSFELHRFAHRLGLGLDPTGITAQLNDGCIYDNYSDFEACNDFLAGDQNIEDESWDIDFGKFLDRWPELG